MIKKQESLLLQLTFPSVFTNSEVMHKQKFPPQNQKTQNIFEESIKQYIQYFEEKNNILEKEVSVFVQKLKENMSYRVGKYRVVKVQEHGCVIVLEKYQEETFTRVYLVYDGSWNRDHATGLNPGGKIYQNSNGNYQLVYIGQISTGDSLEKVYNQFQQQYKKAQQYYRNSNAINSFPCQIIRSCQQAVELVINRNNRDQRQNISAEMGKYYCRFNYSTADLNDQFRQACHVKKISTSWTIQWAIVYFFVKNQEIVKALMLDYKAQLLNKFCNDYYNKFQYDYSDQTFLEKKSSIAAFMSCLQNLRSECQILNGVNNTYYNNQKSINFLTKLSTTIHTLNKPPIQKQYSLQQMSRHYSIHQYSINIPYLIPAITQLNRTNQQIMNNLTTSLTISPANIFEDLLKKSRDQKIDAFLWMLAVQDTIFTIAYNQLRNNFSNFFGGFSLEMIKVYQGSTGRQMENVLMSLLIKYCQRMKQNSYKFAMTLQCQAQSHIELMKAIFAVFAFQIFKKSKRGTPYDVSNFAVPINIKELYNSFNSISYKARRAVQALHVYCEANSKKELFFSQKQQWQKCKIYAEIVSSNSKHIRAEFQKKQNKLTIQKKILQQIIRKFHQQLKQMQQHLSYLKHLPEQCYDEDYYEEQYDAISYRTYKSKRTRRIQCNRCLSVYRQQRLINQHKRKEQLQIQTPIPFTDGLVHQFFYTLDPYTEGLMNLVLISQHEIDEWTNKEYIKQLQLFQRGNLSVYSKLNKNRFFRLLDKKQSDIESLVRYAENKFDVLWKYRSQPTVSYSKMKQQRKQIKTADFQKFKLFLNNPTQPPHNDRQHKIYSQISQKSSKISIDQYLTLGSCRVSDYTQVAVCLEGLLNRSINIDIFQSDFEFKIYIVYRCLSSLGVARPIEFSKKVNQNLWNGTKYFYSFFMDRYYKNWKSHDFSSLPMIGPLLSMMSRTITDLREQTQKFDAVFLKQDQKYLVSAKRVIKNILSKVKIQHERIQKDVAQSSGNQSSSITQKRQNQYFISFGAICCFTEQLLSQSDPMAVQFVRLIVIMKFYEVYLQSSNDKISKYNKVINKYQHYKTRAIEMNIKSAALYFLSNTNQLTDVARIADQGIDAETIWVKDQGGEFLFRGQDKWGNKYKIDIKVGKITKNGESISRVPDIFKNMPEYNAIFQNRDFQVFPSKGKNSLITKRNFTDLFLGNITPEDTVLFEFAYSNNNPTINILIRYNTSKTEQTWRLVSNSDLVDKIPLPTLYTQNYFPWYNASRSCITFRQPALNQIGSVALVAFFQENRQAVRRLTHLHVISKQHYRSQIQFLCNRKLKIFDKLILNQNKKQTAYQVLSRIEKVQYIIEIENYQKQRKFWLHRFDSMFIQDQKNGIIPQSFRSYRISPTPYSHPCVPWNQQSNIRCLIIQKFRQSQSVQQSHNIKIITPSWICNENGRVQIPKAQNINQSTLFYVYDVHDYFGDIRGSNRVAQLHLVSILAAVDDGIRRNQGRVTAMEYAMKVMMSCFNNCPLTDAQLNELKAIIAIASCHKCQSLILACFALLKCTQQIDLLKQNHTDFMVNIFPKYNNNNDECSNRNFRQLMSNTVNKYQTKLKRRQLSKRLVLPEIICEILGVKYCEIEEDGKEKGWRRDNKLIYKLPVNAIQQSINKFNKVLQQWTNLNKEVTSNIVKKQSENESSQKQFPLKIENPQQSTLLDEVTKDLIESYHTYDNNKKFIQSIKINKAELLQKFTIIRQKLLIQKQNIEKIINGLAVQNKSHIDLVTGYLPVLSKFDFVKLVIQNIENQNKNHDSIKTLFDQIFRDFESQQQKQTFKRQLLTLIKTWMLFCIKIDSCNRILLILKKSEPNKSSQPSSQPYSQSVDKIALFRQCQSPRLQIQQKIHWICFEIQMKLQIWNSQYQTFKTLFISNQSGSISQLNMGQGKTQIIIPMIALELYFGGKELSKYQIFKQMKNNSNNKQIKCIPRVNLLQSLINQSKFNYFRYLSVTSFNIPLIILPFDRSVNFKSNQNKLLSITRSLKYFGEKVLILVDQSSVHSLMLKLRQETIKSNVRIFTKENTVFAKMNVFDIFDQVDIQLSAKKSFIYSIGSWSTFDQSEFRINIAAALIQTMCLLIDKLRNNVTFDQTLQQVQKSLKRGEFPRGFRLIHSTLNTPQNIIAFRQIVFKTLVQQIKPDQCSFLQYLNQNQIKQVISYVTNDTVPQNVMTSDKITQAARKVLYTLRGFLAYGVFQHCLYLRCKVNYGIPDSDKKMTKRLAVPYEAADIPSKKNDYAHPDVAILLSFLAYYNYGLTDDEVLECMNKLFESTANNEQVRNQIFAQWHDSLSQPQKKALKITNTLQIHLDSIAQRQALTQTFKLNIKFINYWLKSCVYVKDMIQFKQSITSSSYDQADVQNKIGFSGTKDNCRLLPTYMELVRSENKEIMGTDGKMVDMLIQNVIDVCDVQEGKQSLWERFLRTMFDLPEKYKIGSIIDAGAILASKSLKDHIVPWISKYQQFNQHKQFKGITFCAQNTWKVYKLSSHEYIQRGTSIPDNETFVIFDQYRTRGADVKMDANVTAVLTLSPTITKDSLMQAVGRLRKIGRNQKVVILMTDQVKLKLKKDKLYKDSMSTKQKVKAILSWSCINSVRQNEKYFLPNIKLARIHFNNKVNARHPQTDKSDTSLKKLYAEQITYRSISDLGQAEITQIMMSRLKQSDRYYIEKLRDIHLTYGKKIRIKSQNLQQVCQRQTQKITQFQQQISVQKFTLTPLHQSETLFQYPSDYQHKFNFSPKFKLSQNFIKCTELTSRPYYTYNLNSKQIRNQLMHCFFILMDGQHICMVTLREVYRLLISDGLPFYQIDFQQNGVSKYVARFSDFNVKNVKNYKNNWIYRNKLVEAYVHGKFYNGSTKFQDSLQKNIIKRLLKNEPDRRQKIKYFLDKRRLTYKFSSSTLADLLKQIEFIPQNYDQRMLALNNTSGLLHLESREFQIRNQDQYQEQQQEEQGEYDEEDEEDEGEQDEDEDEEDEDEQQDEQQEEQGQDQQQENQDQDENEENQEHPNNNGDQNQHKSGEKQEHASRKQEYQNQVSPNKNNKKTDTNSQNRNKQQ